MKGKHYTSLSMTLIFLTEDAIRTSGEGVWDTQTKEWVEVDLEW